MKKFFVLGTVWAALAAGSALGQLVVGKPVDFMRAAFVASFVVGGIMILRRLRILR